MCKFYFVFCIKFNLDLCCLSPVREEPILSVVLYNDVVLILLRKERQINITHTLCTLTVAYAPKQLPSPSLSQVFHSTNGIGDSIMNILHFAHVLKLITCLELTLQQSSTSVFYKIYNQYTAAKDTSSVIWTERQKVSLRSSSLIYSRGSYALKFCK